jgi:TetR/AcrR family transcriptional regulator, mexJK operon transcriptional repressor
MTIHFVNSLAMENDICHFSSMDHVTQAPEQSINKVGRPRRGTEASRTAILIDAATRVFLRDGYGLASIDKVASEAGVSTRTIYERFKNKADLLAAVISRLVERDMANVFATAEFDRLEPRDALLAIAQSITGHARNPDSVALFRIVATEAYRFPELAAKMRDGTKRRVEYAIANYFRGQIGRGTLSLRDPDRAAALFKQMICSELHECLLFGGADAMIHLDFTAHLSHVIDIFLFGAVPRTDRPTNTAFTP